MRVTNLMTQNQLLLNLHKSMNALDYLQYQSATGNKIRYASDNPIIAGRSLKFRTNIVETEQYLSNVAQGRSWLQTSANAVKNVLEALVNEGETSLRSLLVSVGGTNTINDSKIYATQLRETLSELKAELNASYAGRYVFSGFKTDEKPIFDVNNNKTFQITEAFSIDDIETDYRYYIKPDSTDMPAEIGSDSLPCYRLKLSYDEGFITPPADINGYPVTAVTAGSYSPGDNEIFFIEDTGELIFGKNVYEDLKNLPEIGAIYGNDANDAVTLYNNFSTPPTKDELEVALAATNDILVRMTSDSADAEDINRKLKEAAGSINSMLSDIEKGVAIDPDKVIKAQSAISEAAIYINNSHEASPLSVTYTKQGFKAGDINPKAYFRCVENGKLSEIDGQLIMYEFGINSKMAVNTLAKDLVPTGLMNDIYDVIKLIEGIEISDKEELVAKFKLDGYSDEEAQQLAENQIEDENKFYVDMIGKKSTELIGKVDKHSVFVSQENTSIGSRLSRLELIYNRLEDDRINYEDLKAENDYVDAAEAYIKMQSMLSVYQSALQTGANIIQMSLVNYV